MSRPCSWPKGCPQWVDQSDALCAYHAKVTAGLINADPRTAMRPAFGIARGAVMSDEQTELAHLLRNLGASPEVVARALTRRTGR